MCKNQAMACEYVETLPYNIDCKKKKMNEYIVGKPELDIFSFDYLNTHF